MRTMKAVLLVAVLAVAASVARAGTMEFGLSGDVAVPLGDLAKTGASPTEFGMGAGYAGGLNGDYWIEDDYAIGLSIEGARLKTKDDAFAAANRVQFPNIAASMTIIPVCVHGIWAPKVSGASLQPWLTGGLGLYLLSFRGDNGPPSFNTSTYENKYGFDIGVGADLIVGGARKVGAHVKYRYVLDGVDVTAFDPSSTAGQKAAHYLTAGIQLTFMSSSTMKTGHRR